MKKLISLFISLVLIIGLGACSPSQDNTEDLLEINNRITSLERDLDLQQEKIEVLEEFYNNVVPTVGLNGQVDYYVNYGGNSYMSMASFTLVKETDYLDKTKFPDYIWDNNDNYISVNDLSNLLTMKYFGLPSEGSTGFQFKIKMDRESLTMTDEEFIVRASMLIMELSEYDFYTIDTTQLYFEFIGGASEYMTVRMNLLVNDSYTLHPAIFWNQLIDTKVVGLTYDELNLESIYDTYITNETFTGYVLPNYK